ncbi:MAG: GNAT family N-acetyltransferase [Pseudonocardia sp.]
MLADRKTIVRTIVGPVHVRPLSALDAAAVVDAVFAGLSPRSRYLRFHSPIPRLTPSLRRALADLDGHRRVAVAGYLGDPAGDPAGEPTGPPIGIARFVATGGPGDGGTRGEADVAVAVVDRWQRRGIGYGLLTALTALAADLGYRRLTGSVLPENTAMLALAERLAPWSRPRWDGDSVRIDIPVGPLAGTADWTITEEDVLADLLAR